MARRLLWVIVAGLCLAVAFTFRIEGEATSETMATGYGYVTMGWLPEAVRQFNQVARRYPDDVEALVVTGMAHQAIGHISEAETLLRRSAELGEGMPEMWALLGDIRLSLGDLDGAARSYEKALADGEEFALALRGLAVVAERRGDTGEAKKYYEEALDVSPTLVWVRIQLARQLIAEEAWDDAHAHLEQARRIRPRDPEPQWLLAQVYLAKGETDRAIHALVRTLQLDPDHADAADLLQRLNGTEPADLL